MNKILLAMGILGAGGGTLLTVRQAALRLGEEAQVSRAAWQVQTQLLAAAQTEQARLTDRVRELRQALAGNQARGENGLWSALQTNTVGHFHADLREHEPELRRAHRHEAINAEQRPTTTRRW